MEACPNIERNLLRCPCTYQPQPGVYCKFRAFCCGCVFNSLRYKSMPACISDERLAKRREELKSGAAPRRPDLPPRIDCEMWQENRAKCVCGQDAPPERQCSFRGWCCDCMARHYSMGSRPACFEQMLAQQAKA